jgi:hypothetical protein
MRIFIFVFIVTIFENKLLVGQEKLVIEKEQPKVLMAVAPVFIPFVFDEIGVTEVIVEVRIDNHGKVVSAKTVSFSLFKDISFEKTAEQWIFEESPNEKERIAQIKFILRIMPKGTSPQELTTIFRYPTEVEIRSLVFPSQITTAPLPDKKKPQKKKSKP